MLQRIVDHEADGLNNVEAMKWINRGLDEKVEANYKTGVAANWHARATRDREEREQAKRADEEAKRGEREAAKAKRDEEKGARDQVRANKNLPQDQLRAMLKGKTEQQVLEALGRPDQTQDQEGLGRLWCYYNTGVDPITGKKAAFAQILFDGNVVTMVNF